MTIRVPLATWDRGKGERLRDILGAHRGDCPVTLEIVRPGSWSAALAPSAYYRVRPDAVLRDEVEALLGPGALVLARSQAPRAASPRPTDARRTSWPRADFEAPLVELQKQIDELAKCPGDPAKEREAAPSCARSSTRSGARSTPSSRRGRRRCVARHPNRPYTLDYVQALFTESTELHGDRRFGDDPALVVRLRALPTSVPVCVVGHQKGRDTKQKIHRNFGMPKPEGYRKALRRDAAGGALRPPDPELRRHAGRLPRARRRGARPGRGDRLEPARDGAAARRRSSSP